MKILAAIFILSFSLFANDSKGFAREMGYELDYKKAFELAKKEKKELMLVMVANFCPWCIKLEKKVLKKKSINDKVHQKYIPLILNREEGRFPKDFETEMIPTVYFIDHTTGKIKTKVVGYNNKQDFINIVNQ